MSRFLLFALTFLTALLDINAQCWPWQDPGKMYFCGNPDKTKCNWRIGKFNCINYRGGVPAVSGYTDGDYECKIYKGDDCEGNIEYVNKTGWSPFPFTPKSYRCPCVNFI